MQHNDDQANSSAAILLNNYLFRHLAHQILTQATDNNNDVNMIN